MEWSVPMPPPPVATLRVAYLTVKLKHHVMEPYGGMGIQLHHSQLGTVYGGPAAQDGGSAPLALWGREKALTPDGHQTPSNHRYMPTEHSHPIHSLSITWSP
jgi:hypothetical protein